MASAADSMDDDGAPAAKPVAKKSRGMLWVVLFAVLLSVAGAGGVSWFVLHKAVPESGEPGAEHADAKPEVPKSPANYFALDPSFVVNLEDARSQRFLQVQVQVMTRDADLIKDLEHHAPRLRSALLLLLGQQRAADLATREGKEKLQADVLAEVQRIILEETGKTGIDAVYFTSFVMQ
ncbi:flagellar basal body protein FliL [Sinimarinibacterium sp. CAU 1509]|uniref:flagellar basal body-associated FliL family protein n=1 Tax=Sinimarinibacterium sp. CAU 1509 TaxID=2562283 RepID=UPI0010AC042E|nr:flagellar basal body-associated FliL family protein [Sinimarinibacterium sp. CAU 1509]TJY62848.1 flagellar basal body protein FliL [Sinimarinibacterium sp. CAU 1509]